MALLLTSGGVGDLPGVCDQVGQQQAKLRPSLGLDVPAGAVDAVSQLDAIHRRPVGHTEKAGGPVVAGHRGLDCGQGVGGGADHRIAQLPASGGECGRQQCDRFDAQRVGDGDDGGEPVQFPGATLELGQPLHTAAQQAGQHLLTHAPAATVASDPLADGRLITQCHNTEAYGTTLG